LLVEHFDLESAFVRVGIYEETLALEHDRPG
jgi:hypothetical protein